MKIVPNRISIILVVILLPFTSVFAAPGPPPPSLPPPPPGLPLDGGLWFLLVLSLLFGIYKLRQILTIKKASN